jgi:hypothetical protein
LGKNELLLESFIPKELTLLGVREARRPATGDKPTA